MNYALVYSLDNVGLAASVIIMVLQVAGSGGSYPIDVLPQLFRRLYPFMPFHYGMDMLRETIGGMYGRTYLRCALILLGMCVLFTVFGLLVYYPARKLNAAIAASKETSGIMCRLQQKNRRPERDGGSCLFCAACAGFIQGFRFFTFHRCIGHTPPASRRRWYGGRSRPAWRTGSAGARYRPSDTGRHRPTWP